MSTNLYTGQVQGLSTISGGVPAAWCRKVSGGTFSYSPHNIINLGIGGQRVVRKGITEVALSITCMGMDVDNIAKFFPTTAGTVVGSFPDFLVDVDDGSAGREWILSGCQPSSVSVSVGGGEDSEVEYTFDIVAKYGTDYSYGTYIPVYNSYSGHTIGDIIVQVDSSDVGAISFDLTNDLGLEINTTMDTKIAGQKTRPDGLYLIGQDPRFSVVTREILEGVNIDADSWTAKDITITMANGIDSDENVTITCDDFVPESWSMPLEAEGAIGFDHEYIPGPGNVYNRVTMV